MTGSADAIVLAGGRSSRLDGEDKARLEIGGRRLVDRAVEAVRVAGVRRCVVVGPATLDVGVPTIQEVPAFGGPVAGIAAGLTALDEPDPDALVLLLACDLADPGAAIAALQRAGDPTTDGIHLADAERRPQWLAGLYRRAALEGALARLGDPHGRSVRDLLAGLDLRSITVETRNVADIDTWEDLSDARHRNGPGSTR